MAFKYLCSIPLHTDEGLMRASKRLAPRFNVRPYHDNYNYGQEHVPPHR